MNQNKIKELEKTAKAGNADAQYYSFYHRKQS